jgi:DNA-binding GntR family transcriptional regulator
MDLPRVRRVPSLAPARSLTERLYRTLRADIVGGRYEPGRRLRPAELAAAHTVSHNVIREALNRLAGERLVVASPQQGFAVPQLSAADLRDLTEVRTLVESRAIRASIDRRTLAWETDLVAAHHRLAGTPVADPDRPEVFGVEWTAAHNAFHAATMVNCGNDRLIRLAADLAASAGIYRHWSQQADHGRRDVVAEHLAIFQAALAGDPDLAVRRHCDHIERTAAIVLSLTR